MTYAINPNAKNVWIRDNEDTMDLSPITDASSVYLENGRTIEQELGEGSMVSNIATVDTSMSKIVDGTLDGAYESCVLKGRSLVNLLNYSFPSRTNWYDNAGANSYIRTGQSISMLKPNTDYLMWFEGETTIVQILALSTVFTKAYFELTGKSLVKVRTVNGELPASFTIHFKSSVGGSLTDNEKASVKLMLIEYIEGMENWDIPYFTGMCDVKMPILRNVGKNLWKHGDLNNFDTMFIDEIVPEGTYCFSGEQTTIYDAPVTIALRDSKSNVLGHTSLGGKITINKKASQIAIYSNGHNYANSTGKYLSVNNFMMEKGSTATTYENHKTNILTTTRKNLFDMNRPYDVITDSQATVVQDTNQITVSSAESGIYVNANFILDKDFFAGKTVTGSCLYESDENDIGTVQIAYQDGNGEHHYQWIKTPKTFTFPNSFIGDVMLSVSANNTGTPQSNTVTVKNIQLELGSTATPYEPYSKVVLRGIGEVKDTLDGNTGELTQKVCSVTLNGEEVWSKTNNNNTHTMYTHIVDELPSASASYTMLCDKIKTEVYINTVAKTYESITIRNGTTKQMLLCLSNDKASDVVTLKQWLSQNPITIQYELAEPIVKTVDLSITDQNGQPTKLKTFNDVTHVSIEAEDLLPTVDLEVPTKIEETLSTLPTLMNDISETQQLLNESIDDQAENINEVSTAMAEIHNDIL